MQRADIRKLLYTPNHRLWLIVVVAALVAAPLFFIRVGTDIPTTLGQFKCFAGQLWQGDLYPRWCMEANAGLGGTNFLFYFPLAYYIAAPFYPLLDLGLSHYRLLDTLVLLASIAGAVTYYSWIKDLLTPKWSVIATLLFLLMPYRMELIYLRQAYAEQVAICLLPLLFKAVRELLDGKPVFIKCASIAGLCLLAHLPIALISLGICGLYTLCRTFSATHCLRVATALFVGIILALFYIVPSLYYHQFMAQESLVQPGFGWPNGFIKSEVPLPAIIGFILSVLGAVVASCMVYRSRFIIDATLYRHELRPWMYVGLFVFVLSMPFTQILYDALGPLKAVIFPWRIQVAYLFIVPLLTASWLESGGAQQRRKTLVSETSIVVLTLLILPTQMAVILLPESLAYVDRLIEYKVVQPRQYRTQWNDKQRWYDEYNGMHAQEIAAQPKVLFVSGEGAVKVNRWSWDTISLKVTVTRAATLELHQYYFPVWQARNQQGNKINLYPDTTDGRIRFDLAAGEHDITFTYSITAANPAMLRTSYVVSIGCALLLMVAGLVRYRRNSRQSHTSL